MLEGDLTTAFGLPLCVDGSTVYRLESMPLVRLLPTVDHVRMVGPSHRPISTASHPPFACAVAASKRSSSTTVEPDRRAHADDRHREGPPQRIECTAASLVEGSSLLGDTAMLGDGAVVDETVGQTSAKNSLARALGSPQRPSPAVRPMRTMIH